MPSDIESKTSKTDIDVIDISVSSDDESRTARMETHRGLKSRHIQLMYVLCCFAVGLVLTGVTAM